MAIIDDVKAAYLAINRKAISDAEATSTAAKITGGTTTLDATIAGYIAGSVETTQAVVALFSYIDGVTPSSAKLTALATDFAVKQFDYYTNVLKSGSATLGPYEALGKALADTDPAFAAIGAPSISDADFISSNYLKIFKVAPTASQAANFQAQITFFTGLYTSAGGVSAAQAALEARGATLGQMIGYAFTDPASKAQSSFDDQVATFLTGLGKGSNVYGTALPAATGGGTPGVDITLTAGNDTVSLTQANPAFKSTVNDDTATGPLNNGDNIDLGGGRDTVKGTLAANVTTDPTAGTKLVLSGVEVLAITGNAKTFDATGLSGVTDISTLNSTTFTNLPATGIKFEVNGAGNATLLGFGTTTVASSADVTLNNTTGAVIVGDAAAAGQLGATAVTLHIKGNSTHTVAIDDTTTLTIDGSANATLTTSGGLAPKLTSIDASADAGTLSLIFITPANNTTIQMTSQSDTFSPFVNTQRLVTVTTGTGNDTVVPLAAPTNVSFNGDGTLKTGLVVTDFADTVDHVDVRSALTTANYVPVSALQQGAINSAATLQAATVLALNVAGNAAGKYTVFTYGAPGAVDTYIVTSDAAAGITAGDGLIKLTGLTTFTVGSAAAGTADIFNAA